MRRILAVVTLWLLVSPTLSAQTSVEVALHYRVANRHDHGVCWWTCAQMIGNAKGIIPLQSIVDKVVNSGVGFKEGATSTSIQYWIATLKLKALDNPPGKKDQEAVRRVQEWLDRGLPVIVSYTWDGTTDTHAVLLLRVGRQKETLTTDKGQQFTDYLVEYIDPNRPNKTICRSWTWFASAWTGRAVTFDPAEQDPLLVRLPELRPGRLLLVDGQWHKVPTLLADAGPIGDRQLPQPPPSQPLPPRPVWPTYQHREPYLAQQPYNQVPYVHIPSNLDLKDGVTRPVDVFQNYAGYGPGYDYYLQYRRK